MSPRKLKQWSPIESDADPEEGSSVFRWLSLVVMTLAAVFFAELLVHALVAQLDIPVAFSKGVLSALLVAIMLLPPLYLLWVKPAFQRARENRMARTLLEELGNGVPEALMMLTPDLKILWANTAAVEEQASDRKTSVLGRTCYAVTHDRDTPCDGKEHACPIHKLTETQREATLLHTHWDGFGMPRKVQVSVVPIEDESGELLRYLHVSRDVTDRIQLEANFAELDQATGKLVKWVDVPVVVTDDDGGTLHANERALAKLGLSAEEMAGEVLIPSTVETDRPVALEITHQSKAVGRYEVRVTDSIWKGQPARVAVLGPEQSATE